MMRNRLGNALRVIETRNALSLSLLTTGTLLVAVLQFVAAWSSLRILTVVLMAAIYTAAVWVAPRGRRARGLSKRYRGMMSLAYLWPLLAIGLAGCALYPLGWFWASGDGLKIGMALSGFFCLQAVAIALLYPLGRRLQTSPDEPNTIEEKPA